MIYDRRTGDCPDCGGQDGEHATTDGTRFRCVAMTTKLLTDGAPHPKCGYAAVRALEGIPVQCLGEATRG